MRISSNYIYETSETAISSQYQRISELENELSTGVLVSSAEVDPVAMASINSLQSQLDSMVQSGKNALNAKTELQTEQTQMNNYESLLERIRTIINKSGTAGVSKDEIKSNGIELQQDIQAIASLANSKNAAGNSIFAGTKKDVNAYHFEKDSEGNITGFTYQGNDNHEKIDLASGVTVNIYQSGDKVFGKGDHSVFTKLIALAHRLKSGESLKSDETEKYLKEMHTFQNMNSNNLTTIENRYKMADFEVSMHDSLTNNYKAMLSKLRDADYTKTVSELSKQMTFLKATMSASMQIEKLSIFNQA